MANTIKIKQSAVAAKLPLSGDLVAGELAINTADQKLYSKSSAGVVFEIGAGGGGGNPTIGTNTDINTSGASVVAQVVLTDGVVLSSSTRTLTLANLGYTGATNANNYTHPSGGSGIGAALSGATVVSDINVNSLGHTTSVSTRTLTLANLGYTGATNANNYTHPSGGSGVAGLSGATVVNGITVNSLGHTTGVSTRNLTAANVGAATSSHTHTTSASASSSASYQNILFTLSGTLQYANVATHVQLKPSNGNLFIAGAMIAKGNVYAYYASDERLKNKRPIMSCTSIIRKWEAIKYTWTEEAKKLDANFNHSNIEIGLSAQSVQSTCPELVSLAPFDYKDGDDQVSKSGQKYLTIDYARASAVITGAIQEMDKRLLAIEAKIGL